MQFTRVSDDGRYQVYRAGTATPGTWFLAPADASLPDPLPLATLWARQDHWALLVAAADLPGTPSALAAACGLDQVTTPGRILFGWWREGAAQPQTLPFDLNGQSASRRLAQQTAVALLNWRLTAPAGMLCDVGDAENLRFTPTNKITLDRGDITVSALLIGDCTVALENQGVDAAGSLSTVATWKLLDVFALGQDPDQQYDPVCAPEVRYFEGTPQGAAMYRYPLFPTVASDSRMAAQVCATLNPALPGANRFGVPQPGADVLAAFTSQALLGRGGQRIAFAPHQAEDGAYTLGFHAAPYWTTGPAAPRYYLAPSGRFTATVGAATALAPGLSGLEWLTLQPDDVLEWRPGQPAFGGQDGAHLDDRITTSWLRLRAAAGGWDYFTQAQASVFFAGGDDSRPARAVNARLAQSAGAPAWPLAPYGNALGAGQSPADLAAFEARFLAPARGHVLGNDTAPQFELDGAPLQTAVTARGLLATLNPAQDAATAAPAGSWNRLALAEGWSLGPYEGVVDAAYANALMQPELFMVFDCWERPQFKLEGLLSAGGFAFTATPPTTPSQPRPVLITKFSTRYTLAELMAAPAAWRGRDLFLAGGDSSHASQVFAAALKTAHDNKGPLFHDFLQRIVHSPQWTGFLLLNASVDGNAMPAGLDILLAGIDGGLLAHHVAVDLTDLHASGGTVQQAANAIAAVISYTNDDSNPPGATAQYTFTTRRLQVGIKSSNVFLFHAEVGLAMRQLFGRDVAYGATNTLRLKGSYQDNGGLPTVTFSLPQPACFRFSDADQANGGDRLLDRFEIDAAAIVTQSAANAADSGERHLSGQISLSGGLWFAADPFGNGLDLLSYGDQSGLRLRDWCLHMAFTLVDGKRVAAPDFTLDYSRMGAAADSDAVRPGSLLAGLPLKLKGMVANAQGLDPKTIAGQPVHCVQVADKTCASPRFALQFELLLGSLGSLSSAHAALALTFNLAWGPRAAVPTADGIAISLQLPGVTAGFKGFDLQGFVKLVFGDANLMRVAGGDGYVYALLCNNVALSVLGYQVPPKVVSDLILFSNPAQPAASMLAACLAIRQT